MMCKDPWLLYDDWIVEGGGGVGTRQQVRGDGGLGPGDGSRSAERWSCEGCVLEVELR